MKSELPPSNQFERLDERIAREEEREMRILQLLAGALIVGCAIFAALVCIIQAVRP